MGNLLNFSIARQLASARGPQLVRAAGLLGWVPIVGTLRRQEWIAVAVEILSAVMAVVLFGRYGASSRTLVLFAGSLVLINTGAIDFRTRMIDTLVLVVAMLVVFVAAPLNAISWLSSALGAFVAGLLFFFLFALAKVLFRGIATPFGLGDVYLAAFIGGLVGFLALPVALFYGMAMAGLVSLVLIALRSMGHTTPTYIAYGTYLCLGALLFLTIGTY
jgi:leader peptidase (prepilin peptidase)/N-methyltransferase